MEKELNKKGITNTPEKKFGAGVISATVWKNQHGNRIYYTTTVEKGYKDKNGEWKSTSHMNTDDLPKIIVVAGKAFEHLSLKEV